MCKTYTWACPACSSLQDVTITCNLVNSVGCPYRVQVSGLPPDAAFNPIRCCYCGRIELPIDVSTWQTPTTANPPAAAAPPAPPAPVTASAFRPPQQTWNSPAGYHHQTPRVPNLPVDPALLTTTARGTASAPPPHGLPTSQHGEYQLPFQHHHNQHHPFPTQQPGAGGPRRRPAPTPSPPKPASPPSSPRTNPPFAVINRQRALVFQNAENLRQARHSRGRRAQTVLAEQLDRAWDVLREAVSSSSDGSGEEGGGGGAGRGGEQEARQK